MAEIGVDDLQFLLEHSVALRFQHSEHDAMLAQQGFIRGDAYSLSAVEQWHPPTPEKTEKFEKELTALAERVFASQMASIDNYDASFLLLGNVDSAHRPVTDRAYGAPFYPVGAFTNFSQEQVLGRVELTRDLIEGMGFDRNHYDPEESPKIVAAIHAHIKDSIIEQIQAARESAIEAPTESKTRLGRIINRMKMERELGLT